MLHGFEDINLSDLSVETSLADLRGKISVRYGRDSAIRVSLFPEAFSLFSLGPVELSIRSLTQPSIVIPRAWIRTNHFSFSAKSGVSNELVLVAPQLTIESGKLNSGRVSALFSLNGLRFLPENGEPEEVQLGTEQFTFRLIDDYVALGKLVKENWSTVCTLVEAENIKVEDINRVQSTVDDMCWLISFAFGAAVGCGRTDIYDSKGTRILTSLRQVEDAEQPFYEPLPLDQLKGELKRFLQATILPFQNKADAYKLRNIIHILVQISAQPVVSIEGLMLANILEIIRYNFALNVMVPRGNAILDGDQFNRPARVKGKSDRLSFGEILDAFAQELGLSVWTPNRKTFIDFRNKIIHEGELLGSSFSEQRKNVLDVLHFCHVAVLALLDWDVVGGKYIPANEDPTRIARSPTGAGESVSLGINLKPFKR